MLKYNGIGHFHSLAEYFHTALLEGDWRVEIYVPQPFRFYFGREIYIPDIYYVREGQCFVGELKPGGEFDEALQTVCHDYFSVRGMTFEVIDNESILEYAMPAQNWLAVVRFLLTYEELDTERARLDVLQQLLNLEGGVSDNSPFVPGDATII